MTRTFTKVVAFALLLHAALSCSCLFQTFEQAFCRTTLSVRAKVLLKYDNCPGTCDPIEDQRDGRIFYLVSVIESFKGGSRPYLILETRVNSALCGTGLRLGSEYLLNLGAPGPSGVIEITSCGAPRVWGGLTTAQMHFVRSNGNGGKGCA